MAVTLIFVAHVTELSDGKSEEDALLFFETKLFIKRAKNCEERRWIATFDYPYLKSFKKLSRRKLTWLFCLTRSFVCIGLKLLPERHIHNSKLTYTMRGCAMWLRLTGTVWIYWRFISTWWTALARFSAGRQRSSKFSRSATTTQLYVQEMKSGVWDILCKVMNSQIVVIFNSTIRSCASS